MEISKIKDKTEKLERELMHLIKKFERETETVVTEVNLGRKKISGRILTEFVAVKVKLDLW